MRYIPDRLEPDILYVAMEHDVAVHLCACGCGQEVVTPFSPAQWSISYNGQSISLSPSIGNWAFPCKSHYWIRNGEVEWARSFSAAEIDLVRIKDALDREKVFAQPVKAATVSMPQKGGWLRRIIGLVSRAGRD